MGSDLSKMEVRGKLARAFEIGLVSLRRIACESRGQKLFQPSTASTDPPTNADTGWTERSMGKSAKSASSTGAGFWPGALWQATLAAGFGRAFKNSSSRARIFGRMVLAA